MFNFFQPHSAVIGVITTALTAQEETQCGEVLLEGQPLKAHIKNPFNRFLIISSYANSTSSFLTMSVLVCKHRLLIFF